MSGKEPTKTQDRKTADQTETEMTTADGTAAAGGSIDAEWTAVSSLLRAEIGEASYQSWLRPMSVRGLTDGVVTIAVPTRFMRDWAAAHYQERLAELWRTENAAVGGVEIVVRSQPAGDGAEGAAGPDADGKPTRAVPWSPRPPSRGAMRARDDLSAPLGRALHLRAVRRRQAE